MLNILEVLFFKPYSVYQRHVHNITIQYCRWKLGKTLQTSGYFFLSPKSHINARVAGAVLRTDGLYLHDYSQINLETSTSVVQTGNEVRINRYCNFNIWSGQLLIGNNVSFNNYCSINCMESIEIGNNTWFGEGVRFYDHNHKFKDGDKPFTDQGFTTGKIKIGNNCWIGSNCIILQNVEIGDNCVIGANNLIFKSLPPNTIVKAKAMEIIEAITR